MLIKHTDRADVDNISLNFRKIYLDSGKFNAKKYLDDTIKARNGSKAEIEARLLRGKGYEAGWFGVIDYEAANKDYCFILNSKIYINSKIIEECMLGRARIFYAKKVNFDEIKSICTSIQSNSGNHKASTLLGFAYEVFENDYKNAAKCFISSFVNGSKRALAYYSYAKYKSGNYICSIISLMMYYLLYPFLSIFDKSKYNLY